MKTLTKPYLIVAILTYTAQVASSQNLQDSGYKSHAFNTYQANHFSVQLNNGFNSTKYQLISGTDKPLRRISYIHNLKLEYIFNNQKNLGLGVGAGLGFFSLIEKVAPKDPYHGTDGWNYFQRASYVLFGRLNGSLKYYEPLSKSYIFKSGIELGALFFSNESVGVSQSVGQPHNIVEYELDYDFTQQPKPYINITVGLDKVIRNMDMIGLKFGFEYMLTPVLHGTFEMYDASSKGIIINRGSNLNVSLEYVFTGNQRRKFINQNVQEDSMDPNHARKEYKKQTRYISPKSLFVSVSGGTFSSKTNAQKGSREFKSSYGSSGNIRLAVEKGLKRNFFAEVGTGYNEYWSSVRHKANPSSSQSYVFETLQLSAGIGKRIVSKQTNRNLLNLHVGFASDIIDRMEKGYIGASMGGKGQLYPQHYYDFSKPGYSQIAEDYLLKKSIGSIYVSVSKDFLLSKRLFLFLAFRYHKGLWKVVETKVSYESTSVPNEVRSGSLYINGTSHSFNFGIKYRLRY